MEKFRAIEYSVTKKEIKKTGKTEVYLSENLLTAVSQCLYTHRLHNAIAYIGISGKIVHCGNLSYYITADSIP